MRSICQIFDRVEQFGRMKCTGTSKGSQGSVSNSANEMHIGPGRLSPLPRGPLVGLPNYI